MIKCKICGKEFNPKETSRKKYCCYDCYLEANRLINKERGRQWSKSYPIKKCPYCGKEFNPRSRVQIFCCYKCRKKFEKQHRSLKIRIKDVSKLFDFDVKNFDKISKAKHLLFKDGNIFKCPCDANNPERYCGSPLCVYETATKGHCHCSLFWAKNTLQNKK